MLYEVITNPGQPGQPTRRALHQTRFASCAKKKPSCRASGRYCAGSSAGKARRCASALLRRNTSITASFSCGNTEQVTYSNLPPVITSYSIHYTKLYDVVLGLNHGVVMRHQDLVPAHDGADRRACGQIDVLHPSSDDLSYNFV